MTAELLGWIKALSAFVHALTIRIRGYRSPWHLLPALGATTNRPFQGQITSYSERGFTLTELMVAVSIAGVLSAAAAPSLMAMTASQQVKTATLDFYTTLAYARSEAIKRNTVITITPHDGNFAKGYDLGAGGLVLGSKLGTPAAVTIHVPTEIPIAFDGYGRLTTSAPYRLELSSAQDSSIAKRCVIISSSGRASIQVDNDHDGNCFNG